MKWYNFWRSQLLKYSSHWVRRNQKLIFSCSSFFIARCFQFLIFYFCFNAIVRVRTQTSTRWSSFFSSMSSFFNILKKRDSRWWAWKNRWQLTRWINNVTNVFKTLSLLKRCWYLYLCFCFKWIFMIFLNSQIYWHVWKFCNEITRCF